MFLNDVHQVIILFIIPCLSSIHFAHSNIYKVVAAQGASTLVAALEPAEQADRVESVLASGTTLVGGLHVGRYDRITDSTLTLTLQSTLHISPECQETIDQVTIGKHNDSLDCNQPALPFLLINKHSAATDHQCGV